MMRVAHVMAALLALAVAGAAGDSCRSGSGSGSGTYCGGKSAGSCWCNTHCVRFNDCCSDYSSVCVGTPATPVPSTAVPATPKPSTPSPVSCSGGRVFDEAEGRCAVVEPLPTRSVHDLDDFAGTTFLNFMLAENGLVQAMDADWDRNVYRWPTWEAVERALDNFDTKNVNRVWWGFGYSSRLDNREATAELMRSFNDEMQGRTFTNENILSVMGSRYFALVEERVESSQRAWARRQFYPLGHFFLMAAGGGTLVVMDRDNYFYNAGYEPGNERSGRSYAASPHHRANDVSHKSYLEDLEEYLVGSEQDELFFTVVGDVVTNTDDSRYGELSPLGQSVATDFIAVYVAELRRHLMANLDPDRWEWGNDYLEATLVGAYGAVSGKVMIKVTDAECRQQYRLRDEPMWKYWELNEATGRSGIGKTQSERRVLQRHFTAWVKRYRPGVAERVEALTGKATTDVIRNFAEYLNNYSTPRSLPHAKELSRAVVDFLMTVQANADAITQYVLSDSLSPQYTNAPQPGDMPWIGKYQGVKQSDGSCA